MALELLEKHQDIKAGCLMAPALIYKQKSNYLAPLVLPFKKHIPWSTTFQLDEAGKAILDVGYHATSVHAAIELNKLQHMVRADLCKITSPIIVFQSKADTMVSPKTENYLLKKVKSAKKVGYMYEKTSHVISLDSDKQITFERTIDFFASVK